MQFSLTSNGLSQTSYSLCIQKAVTGMQNSEFFHLWQQVSTSLSQIMTNAVLALHMVAILKMFSTKQDPGPQAIRHLLSVVLALFTLLYFTCKGLCDFFDQKTCCSQTNPLHGLARQSTVLYRRAVHVAR